MAAVSTDDVPPSPLQTILNFRDIGNSINGLLDHSLLREGLIFRSARPDDASPSDRTALTQVYHIRTIIDLRSATEHIEQAKKHDTKFHSSALISPDEGQAAKPLEIPGVSYHEINLNGGAFSRALLMKLRWTSLTKLLALMTTGYRIEAISILGREVMAPRGLIGLGKDTLVHSRKEIYQVFSALAQARSYPCLIHCTQGKDRTGLCLLLILLLLGVPLQAISADYMASERFLEPEREQRLVEIRQMGLGDEFAGCPGAFVTEIKSFIDSSYGGIDGYLETCKVDSSIRERIKEKLLSTRQS